MRYMGETVLRAPVGVSTTTIVECFFARQVQVKEVARQDGPAFRIEYRGKDDHMQVLGNICTTLETVRRFICGTVSDCECRMARLLRVPRGQRLDDWMPLPDLGEVVDEGTNWTAGFSFLDCEANKGWV